MVDWSINDRGTVLRSVVSPPLAVVRNQNLLIVVAVSTSESKLVAMSTDVMLTTLMRLWSGVDGVHGHWQEGTQVEKHVQVQPQHPVESMAVILARTQHAPQYPLHCTKLKGATATYMRLIGCSCPDTVHQELDAEIDVEGAR